MRYDRNKSDELTKRRRLQIIEAAERSFRKRGFHATTLREIAAEFGMSVGHIYNYFSGKGFPVYAETRVQESLKREYAYAFGEHRYPGVPDFILNTIDENPFTINGVTIIPVRAMHYKLPVLGFRFGRLGYLTDANSIPDESIARLKGVDIFVINCIRREKHISHFSLDEALEVCRKVGARHSFLTHLSHQLDCHASLAEELPEGVEPAYDGLSLTFRS